jgi:hypothetical protein
MPYRANYPATVAEVLDPTMTFRPGVLSAVRAFRQAGAWRGKTSERIARYRTLNAALAACYGVPEPRLMVDTLDGTMSGASCYRRADHSITLRGRLSVVTFLHEFGHARGFDERKACRFSINLFRRVFPQSFARCRFEGHVLIRGRRRKSS